MFFILNTLVSAVSLKLYPLKSNDLEYSLKYSFLFQISLSSCLSFDFIVQIQILTVAFQSTMKKKRT
jgi:hypothetical protein